MSWKASYFFIIIVIIIIIIIVNIIIIIIIVGCKGEWEQSPVVNAYSTVMSTLDVSVPYLSMKQTLVSQAKLYC